MGAVTARILIAGVGNIFLGDDGFGPEVIRHLGRCFDDDDSVRVADYGIGGMHLAYDLLDGWDRLILVDLLPGRGRPGTVHVVRIDPGSRAIRPPDPHGMAPHTVLAAASEVAQPIFFSVLMIVAAYLPLLTLTRPSWLRRWYQ